MLPLGSKLKVPGALSVYTTDQDPVTLYNQHKAGTRTLNTMERRLVLRYLYAFEYLHQHEAARELRVDYRTIQTDEKAIFKQLGHELDLPKKAPDMVHLFFQEVGNQVKRLGRKQASNDRNALAQAKQLREAIDELRSIASGVNSGGSSSEERAATLTAINRLHARLADMLPETMTLADYRSYAVTMTELREKAVKMAQSMGYVPLVKNASVGDGHGETNIRQQINNYWETTMVVADSGGEAPNGSHELSPLRPSLPPGPDEG